MYLYYIIILIILIVVSAIVIRKQNAATPPEKASTPDDDCCGAHAVCEKDSLLSSPIDVTYFDDEELDTLAFRTVESFSDNEIKMIEEVFYSLRETDVAAWIRSIQIRGINIPDHIKEEAILIISERRQNTEKQYNDKH